MKIKITAREIIDQYRWPEFCDLKGINMYAINEGLMEDTDEFELTAEEAKKIGLKVLKSGMFGRINLKMHLAVKKFSKNYLPERKTNEVMPIVS